MPIDADYAVDALLYDEPIPSLVAIPSLQQKRDRADLVLFVDECRTFRSHRPDVRFTESAVRTAVGAVNARDQVTVIAVRAELGALYPAADVAPAPAPATGVAGFVALLDVRRGYYRWAAGSSDAFCGWLRSPAALTEAPSSTAVMNCWEPILVAAVQSGLLGLRDVADAYEQPDRAAGVLHLLKPSIVQTIVRTEGVAPRENRIEAGDILLISGPDGPLHHVVAVAQEAPAALEQLAVLSLWRNVGGQGLTRLLLRDLLPFTVEIRHVRL